jgi:serine/threonine protein kinase
MDRYRVISRLGAGGMATVSLAEDRLLGRRVALKRLHISGDVQGRSRLRREALAGAASSHPNLVSIFDVVTEAEGDLVIVMEYVDGENLATRLDRDGRLAPEAAVPILSGVAAALDVIHRAGIIHRDVKPANVLLGSDGSVKLTDLGIAAVVDSTRITTVNSVVGSFSYMAPEQLEGADATPAIDIYALGALAFEVLGGRKARTEDNPLALAHAIATQPPPDLRDAWPQAPARAAEIIAGAMSRDPAERPHSAEGFTRALTTALVEERPRPRAVAAAAQTVTAATRVAASPAPRAAASRQPPPSLGLAAAAPGRARRALPLLAALIAAAIVAAVALGSSGGSPSHRRTASRSSRHATSTRSGTNSSTTGSATATSGTAGPTATSSTAGSTTTAAPGSAAPTPAKPGPAAAHGPQGHVPPGQAKKAPGAAGGGPGAGGGAPTGAVQSFYHLAAAHQYSQAWALADPAFQQQLGGYDSFRYTMSNVRSITFNSARTTSQSASGATVAFDTTSAQTTQTQHCTGTVALVPSSGTWLLHHISISCTSA